MFRSSHITLFKPVLILLALLVSLGTSAQTIPDDNTVAMIRANYLYQFASNSNWPSEWKKGTFNAAIVGNPEVSEIMASKYAGKPIGSQSLNVMGASEMAVTPQVHVLFVDRSKKADLAKYVKEYKGKSTLIVTNWEGALAQGAHINFLSIDGSIRFELNKTAMTEALITPGIKILQWAIE